MTNRNVIYTAIYGGYDCLKEPEYVDNNCDYICYTDQDNLKSKVWDIRQRVALFKDPNRSAKIFKILPHLLLREYCVSVWVDASMRIKKSLLGLYLPYLKHSSFSCFKHPDRDCVYEEAETCKIAKNDLASLIDAQIERYRASGYPEHSGLYACTTIARNHNKNDCVKLCTEWYSEIENNSRRDQISLPYVAWKQKFKIETIDLNLWDNEYFEVLPHKKHIG